MSRGDELLQCTTDTASACCKGPKVRGEIGANPAGMMQQMVLFGALFTLACASAGAEPSATPVPVAAMVVRIVVTPAIFAGLPRRAVTAVDESGTSATFSGVDLGLLIGAHGAPQGPVLRGRALADVVVVSATDGYRVVFALPELDATFTRRAAAR